MYYLLVDYDATWYMTLYDTIVLLALIMIPYSFIYYKCEYINVALKANKYESFHFSTTLDVNPDCMLNCFFMIYWWK